MKCFLLLAAVYSLIIHQWHKENGEATEAGIVKTVPKKLEQKKVVEATRTKPQIPATKSEPQFVVLFSFLKMNK